MEHPNVFISNNSRPFGDVTGNRFGRYVLKTNADRIDASNVADELSKVLPTHNLNVIAIDYLDEYYKGNQPILYRVKPVRPEINNRVVENHAYETVESNVANIFGEPVMYADRKSVV